MAKSITDLSCVTTVGLDLAKSSFHVHCVDERGRKVLSRPLRRGKVLEFLARLKPCLIGLEACATAHYWAREIAELGHDVRLIPPSYVKPYIGRQKNDAADAAGICEAVSRPCMRFVPIKAADQQSALMLHRVRSRLISQRTALINAMRGHFAEFGIVAAQGRFGAAKLMDLIQDGEDIGLPQTAYLALLPLVHQIKSLQHSIDKLDQDLLAWHRANADSRRLEKVPGFGPVVASALVASVTDPAHFKSAREFAAFLGLVPKQASTGGKEKLGKVTGMGDRYLRSLLVTGAAAVLRHAKKTGSPLKAWAMTLLEKKPFKLAAVALANKMARIAFAMLVSGNSYRAGKAQEI